MGSHYFEIRSPELTAAIDPEGAQLSVLRAANGAELLWHGDPAWWAGRAPILFPVVGALNGGTLLWHDQRYPLPRHGFARGRRFELVRQGAGDALFRLGADAETHRVYPFDFVLDVAFTLDGARLRAEASVHNAGREAMPASLGFHPAFRWPLPGMTLRTGHYLEFDRDEPAPVRRLNAAGLLTPQLHLTPVAGRRLALDDALFADDVVIFDQLAGQRVVYGAAAGPRIAVEFPDARYLGLWTKPGAGYVCIEPWRGIADPVGFEGEFSTKPGVFLVPPGGHESLTMTIEVLWN